MCAEVLRELAEGGGVQIAIERPAHLEAAARSGTDRYHEGALCRRHRVVCDGRQAARRHRVRSLLPECRGLGGRFLGGRFLGGLFPGRHFLGGLLFGGHKRPRLDWSIEVQQHTLYIEWQRIITSLPEPYRGLQGGDAETHHRGGSAIICEVSWKPLNRWHRFALC